MTSSRAVLAAARPFGFDDDFASSIVSGLAEKQKRIESKWLYDDLGSQLFDAVTALDDYYPTRTEVEILQQNVSRLAHDLKHGTVLIELGSGSSIKTRLLLDALPDLQSYMPIDISEGQLLAAAGRVHADYPNLKVTPIVGDFTADLMLPKAFHNAPKLLFFPGSTIGNFDVDQATALLKQFRKLSTVSAFVIGIDLVKPIATLIRAYDDSEGVTAKFNLNLLSRINRELDADFDLGTFHHETRWNATASRVEMHLVSDRDQRVHIAGRDIAFNAGETIHTENSHKYTPEHFEALANKAGWRMDDLWTDANDYFGVAVLSPGVRHHGL